MSTCFVCEQMKAYGFEDQEILDYHESKITIDSFDKTKRQLLLWILEEAADKGY